jgi:hypothetical protein
MKRLIAFAGLGIALSGCVVTIIPPAASGSISNLRSQAFYCINDGVGTSTTNVTNFKFKFDVTGTISGYEVYVSNPDASGTASTPQALGGVQGPRTETASLSAASGRVARAVQITGNGANAAPTLGTFVGTVSTKPLAVVVSQGSLWVRPIRTDGSFGNYVESKELMTPSSDKATCETAIGNVP